MLSSLCVIGAADVVLRIVYLRLGGIDGESIQWRATLDNSINLSREQCVTPLIQLSCRRKNYNPVHVQETPKWLALFHVDMTAIADCRKLD